MNIKPIFKSSPTESHFPQLEWFDKFIDEYSPTVYSALSKLTGLPKRSEELDNLNVSFFVSVWWRRNEYFQSGRRSTFLIKMLFKHALTFLEERGTEDSIKNFKSLYREHLHQ